MTVRLIPVTGKRELKQFIYLPEQLHRDHPMWMPPLYMDEWDYFNPKKNRAFGYCDTTMMLAEQDGRARRAGDGDHQPPPQRDT